MTDDTTRQELIDDLKGLIEEYGKVTRDFYREHGKFSEKLISKFFPTFKDFVAATDYDPELVLLRTTIPVPLNRVTAKYRNDVQYLAVKSEIDALKEDLKKDAPLPTPISRNKPDSGNMLEIVVPDLHAGKLSWHEETNSVDWDTKLAEQAYYNALATLLDRSSEYFIEKIVLVVGNDLLNSDNLNSTTTKGTLVNTDTRPQKTYRAVRRMLVNSIEYLRKYAPVVVKIVPGNHDTFSDFTLGDSLECWFHNYEDVYIDNAPNQHKMFKWGQCLIAWVHGDKGKKDDYGIWLATEYPKEFGDSKFREIHTGHLHKTKLDEKFGVRVRILSALCPPDAWHSNNFFKNNLRVAEGFIWNKDEGLISIVFHTEID